MEVVRDLIRDLVGIIFPGSFLVFTAFCFIVSLLFLFYPAGIGSEISALMGNSGIFYIFLVLSYIAGQSLRIKQLGDLEDRCTALYRKNAAKKGLSQAEYEKSVALLRQEEESYAAGQSTREKLSNVFDNHVNKYGLWEKFPYPIYIKWRRLLSDTNNQYEFFEKYEKQGVTGHPFFFSFCQTAVYEHSASLKEELLRQEALIRLFAGMFYALIFGRVAAIITLMVHTMALVLLGRVGFLPYLQDSSNASTSWIIVIIALLSYLIFEYLNREILKRLRSMRVKEVRLTYESFYLISKKHQLDL